MHMADALISPAVGASMWAVTAGLLGYSSRRVKKETDERKVPLMGAVGAFVFAAQMINFTIPATGSSGHLGGGLIMAVLLGPHAAFLTMASVLTVQAFFFGDGGILALGCNIFNLAFFPSFIVYPLIYKAIAGQTVTRGRILGASLLGAVVGLQMGAFSVVVETLLSGITELSFGAFLLLMQPIHLAIGLVEGLATAAVVLFVHQARPEILLETAPARSGEAFSLKKILIGFGVATLLVGGALSWFASAHPDGLEWSIARVTGKEELEAPDEGIHSALASLQEATAFLPDYGFAAPQEEGAEAGAGSAEEAEEPWPAVDAGTSLSGIVGGFLTFLIALMAGLALKRISRNPAH